jgi:predicted ATP-grasp superfamily ATP-dependent carboligase
MRNGHALISGNSNQFRIKPRKRPVNEPLGAVVLGGDYQGLGIVRSLGVHGVPICVIDDECSIARHSRFTTFGVRVPDLHDEETAIETLLKLGEHLDLEGWVLFPTRDEQVAALSRHRSELAECFRVSAPAWETVQWMWDKRNTYRLSKQLGIPFPETWFPQTVQDLAQIEAPFPLVIKPAIKEHFFYVTKAKAWRANNKKELQELFGRAIEIAGPGEMMVQDLIPGDGRHQFGYCAFFKDGKPLGSMVSRRMRQHPYEFGRASTFVESIDLPALETLSERFLQATNYYGLVEVEYKLDPRDGQFKLLDVNARTWGYHTLGSHAGVDFPYLLYLDQTGRPVEPHRGVPGISWIRLLTDIPTGIIDMVRGRTTARDYFRSVRNFHGEAVFTRKDLLPALIECALLPYLYMKRGF